MLTSTKEALRNYIEFYSSIAGLEMSDKLNIVGNPDDIVVFDGFDIEDIPGVIKEVR